MAKGYQATKDGRFQGRRIICAVCGRSGRKPEMVKQRGAYVHRSTCKDNPAQKARIVPMLAFVLHSNYGSTWDGNTSYWDDSNSIWDQL